jgi:hypothetical protein
VLFLLERFTCFVLQYWHNFVAVASLDEVGLTLASLVAICMDIDWSMVYIHFVASPPPPPPPPPGPISMNAPVSTTAIGLLCNPKYCIQPKFHNPVPRMKRQRSLTEAVRMSVGSTTRYPKKLKHWWANALQQQIMCCAVSSSSSQNLQVCRCVLTGACPVRIATTIFSWCLLNLTFRNLASCMLGRPHRYPPNTAFYIFFQQLYVRNFLNMLHTRWFFLFRM